MPFPCEVPETEAVVATGASAPPADGGDDDLAGSSSGDEDDEADGDGDIEMSSAAPASSSVEVIALDLSQESVVEHHGSFAHDAPLGVDGSDAALQAAVTEDPECDASEQEVRLVGHAEEEAARDAASAMTSPDPVAKRLEFEEEAGSMEMSSSTAPASSSSGTDFDARIKELEKLLSKAKKQQTAQRLCIL